jgi:hypothetical protein
MKHATASALEALGDLLVNFRARPDLVEKRQGIFYLKGRAFLHFHEDHSGVFADLRQGGNWRRFPVNSSDERTMLLETTDWSAQARD